MAEGRADEASETLSSSTSKRVSNLAERFGLAKASRKMLRMIDYALGVAPTRYPVLINGESGTGKKRFAR
jgi:DNA-binding NtrC family response regulator